jgi:F0F1-type ATP synthase assembly protein I
VDLQERRQLHNGFGNTFSRSVEFVVTPLLFALFGHFLDGRFGTSPVVAITLGLFGVFGMFARTWYAYIHAMDAEQASGPWAKR